MKSFPFDSDLTFDVDGNPEYDRGADSTILSEFLHLLFTDGVFPNPSTGLQVVSSSNEMSVEVRPGNVMIQGRMGIEESSRTLVFSAAGTSYDRIDSVVARLNTNHDYRDVDLYVIKGTESGSPVPPDLTRTGGIWELRLANVFIAKNTAMISAERITDTRLNTEQCGIVVANPKNVDTTDIFNQYQAALDKYLKYVEESIDGITLIRIEGCIKELNDKMSSAYMISSAEGKFVTIDSVESNLAILGIATNVISYDVEKLKRINPEGGLVKWEGNTKVWNKLRFTANGDGSITVDGSGTEEAGGQYIILAGPSDPIPFIKGEKYTISGSSENIYVNVQLRVAGTENTWTVFSSKNGESVIIDTNLVSYDAVRILVGKASRYTVANNEIIKPMIELGTVSHAYNPYHPNGHKISVTNKNLIPYPYAVNTVTHNGIAFTGAADGTILATGTNNGSESYMQINGTVSDRGKMIRLPRGKCVISGCPSNGSASSYNLQVCISEGPGAVLKIVRDVGAGVVIEVVNDRTRVSILPTVTGKTAVNGVLFKPQLEIGDNATIFEINRTQEVSVSASAEYPVMVKSYDYKTHVFEITENDDCAEINVAYAVTKSGALLMDGVIKNAKEMSYDGSSSGSDATNVQDAIDSCLKSVADGKKLLAGTISKLVDTAADSSFATINANISSAFVKQYNRGVTDADARANPSSTNYKTGYNAGVTAADGRANPSSNNYQSGYNAGITAGRANITTRYFHDATDAGATHTHDFYIYVPAGYNYLTFSYSVFAGYSTVAPVTVLRDGSTVLYSASVTTSGSGSNIRMAVSGASYVIARVTMHGSSTVDMTGVLSVS